MLGYEFFSDCTLDPCLTLLLSILNEFEYMEVAEVLLSYLLHHFKFSFWFSGHSWELLLKRRQGNLSTFNLKISLIT